MGFDVLVAAFADFASSLLASLKLAFHGLGFLSIEHGFVGQHLLVKNR